MGASKACKEAGLKSVIECAELSGKTSKTIYNWYRYNRTAFNCVVAGAVVIKKERENE